jgi:excisionase family DNA binding protein
MLVGDLVTTKEAAELLRVSHWTVSAWLSQGKLLRVKAGGRTLIAKADLEAFLTRADGMQDSQRTVKTGAPIVSGEAVAQRREVSVRR